MKDKRPRTLFVTVFSVARERGQPIRDDYIVRPSPFHFEQVRKRKGLIILGTRTALVALQVKPSVFYNNQQKVRKLLHAFCRVGCQTLVPWKKCCARCCAAVVVGNFLLLQCFSGNISVPAQGADNETAFFNLKVAVYETIGKSCDALDDVPMQMTEELKLKVNVDIRLNEVTWRRNTHIYGSYFDSTHRENVAKVK